MSPEISVPDTMQVVEIATPGGPEVLRLASRTVPKPGPGEVLVKVEAAGVNRADASLRSGRTQAPPGASDIPGLEVAGRVVALGSGDAGAWRTGEACMALTAFGGYAEFCAIPAPQCLPVPTGLRMVEAAATMETFATVWSNVFQTARLAAGEWLLVHGGGSGIGTTAIQLAKASGARVMVTAGDDARCTRCLALGADVAVNYRRADFVAEALAATSGRGVDVLLDSIGGDYLDRNVAALGLGGRLVMIALLRGRTASIDLLPVIERRIVLTGSQLKTRSPAEKGDIASELRERVIPMIEAGRVRPVIDMTFPLEAAADAHRRLEGDHFGKIVLIM